MNTVWFLFLLLCCYLLPVTHAQQDAAALQTLKSQWKNVPPNWRKSSDPCGIPSWDGVTCNNSRVTQLQLSGMNLKGTLEGDIGELSELKILDLSFNRGLTGSFSPWLGNLRKLQTLILSGCGFTGSIPTEIGNLTDLTFLALNFNNFTGKIPPSLGNLPKLYWLDISDNQLSGSIPISTATTPGLDQLHNTKHFHFSENNLMGKLPPELFSSQMSLIHFFVDGNQLTGNIPSTLGLVTNLTVLRLDRNSLDGEVPSSIQSLTYLKDLRLASNKLEGPVPDLTGMMYLEYVDLSNNSFHPSEAPSWFSTIKSLTTIVMEHGKLQGHVPPKIFSLPLIQQVKLRNNEFNGTLEIASSISQILNLVDFENNKISYVTPGVEYKKTLILNGNPVCKSSNFDYCTVEDNSSAPGNKTYSTSLAECIPSECPSGQTPRPQTCHCAYPYIGILYLRAVPFRDLTNASLFISLEKSLTDNLKMDPGSVSLQNLTFNGDDYLQIQLELFPSTKKYFTRKDILTIGFDLTNQNFKLRGFGPYMFNSSLPYPFPEKTKGIRISLGMVVGIAIGISLLILGLIGLAIYSVQQKKRAERAIELNKPYASWSRSRKDSGAAPQLKGARWFSFGEIRKCTNNFNEDNVIGTGGFGEVYRGLLSNGEVVAIKRARQGSKQGVNEFRTEIELLSRVHHKNLVGLVGFCFEQGELMLVYEFMPNGTVGESLSGKSGITLDWNKRLHIALGSARGLAYLHDLANPPIIHRDVKTANILLDENLNAKVADFGLSKLISDTAKEHVSTQVKGTMGYLDPEYYMTQHLTDKSDVYSFGIVMLELVTGKQPIEKGKHIVRAVQLVMNKNDELHYGLKEIMDPTIKNPSSLAGFAMFIDVAMQCVEESTADRPTMNDVVKEIEMIFQTQRINTTSNSATDFGSRTGKVGHPYTDALPRKVITRSGSFDYSGGYVFSARIEPK